MATKDSQQQLHVLNINDLAEILHLLRRHGYSGTSYYELGLSLGLLPGTLDVIKENNKGDVNSCLRECLKAWLKEADDVKSVRVCKLIQALRELGENAVADGIDKEKHPACAIFKQCESNECILAALPSLAILLYKEKIIGEMLLPTTGEVLLKAVKEAVCADHHNLEKFAGILTEKDKSTGKFLLHEYKSLFPADCTITEVKVNLPLKLCTEFEKIRNKFNTLKIEVAELAKAMMKEIKIDELKAFFSTQRAHLKSRIASCKTVYEVMLLMGESCSMISYNLLEVAINRFNIKGAESAVEKYKKELNEFYKGRPLRDFLDKRLGSTSCLLQYKKITISVHKSIDEFQLADIDILMTCAFQDKVPEVDLEFVREGNSFTITCSFPVLLSESLIATALDNIDSLIERGVKKLTIGYSTVYDHEKIFKHDELKHDETATLKISNTVTSEMKQQLYASVYSSQGTMEQVLISRTIQLLNSEEELASVQQLKDENEKLEAEMKRMKLEVSQLKAKEEKKKSCGSHYSNDNEDPRRPISEQTTSLSNKSGSQSQLHQRQVEANHPRNDNENPPRPIPEKNETLFHHNCESQPQPHGRQIDGNPPRNDKSVCYQLVIWALVGLFVAFLVVVIFFDSQGTLANYQNDKKIEIEKLERLHLNEISTLKEQITNAEKQIDMDKNKFKMESEMKELNYTACKQEKAECMEEKQALKKDLQQLSEQKAALNLKYTTCDSERPAHNECKEDRKNCYKETRDLKSDMAALDVKYAKCDTRRDDFEQCKVERRELEHSYKKLEGQLSALNIEAVRLNITYSYDNKEMKTCDRRLNNANVMMLDYLEKYVACLKDKNGTNIETQKICKIELTECLVNLRQVIDTSSECQEKIDKCWC